MKLLLYCTKAKPILRDYRGKAIYNRFVISPTDRPFTSDDTQPILNGKIIGECDFEVEKIESRYIDHEYSELKEICNKSCLSTYALMNYARKDKFCFELSFYAIHIKNLTIYDKPRELNEVCKYDTSYNNMFGWLKEESEKYIPLDKAPQNMCYVYDKGEKKVLISIRPQWMCLIANRVKDVEVRKVVLKEMMKK